MWVPPLAVFLNFSLCFLGVPAVQVRSLYTMMKYDIQNPKRAAYMDAWHLRRLYTFSFRRQLDTHKRGQKPRDWSVETYM